MASEIGALAVRIVADIGDLLDGFNRADKATEKFSRQLDKRLTEPLAKFAATAAAAGAAVLAFTKNAADLVDELGKMSQKVGISIERLSGLKYAAELNNVSLGELGQGLKQLSKFMVENKVVGVGVEEQLLRIADEFARTTDDEYKTAAAMKYFGKAGADLIPLLNQGRAGIEELRKEAAKLGIVFTSEAAKAAEEFNDNLTRLKASAQGLQVELAGPLVEALNKAAKAMLDAKKNGDGLFSTLVDGWRTLTTGDDAHKWNVEFTKAVDEMLDAEKRLSEARARSKWLDPFGEGLKAAERRVAAAKADIERLQAIKAVLAPEAPAAAAATAKPSMGKDGIDEKALDEVIEAGKAAMQREQEIRDASHAARVADDAREIAQVVAQNEARAKAQEDGRLAEIESAQIVTDELERIRREDFQAQKAKAAAEKALNRERLSATGNALGDLASLMNTSSRRTFQIGKIAAMAEAGVKTTLAVINSYEHGTKIGGHWVGLAFAAASAAAGLNMINNLRNQQFGGGAGAPTPAGQGSSGVAAPDAGGGGGQASRGPDTFVVLNGERFGRKQVRDMLVEIGEEHRDGGRVVVLDR